MTDTDRKFIIACFVIVVLAMGVQFYLVHTEISALGAQIEELHR